MKKQLFLFLLAVFIAFRLNAQSGAAINAIGATADPSAMLDISSINSGILIPRMEKAQRTAIPSPAEGLMVYQTNDTTGFWFYNGTKWNLIGSDAGSGLVPGSYTGNTLYWDGNTWVESSNIFNAGGSVGIGTNSPESTSSLELGGVSKGFLINRMTTAERNAISNPAQGLQIYNITTRCFEYFEYGIWQQLHCAVCPIPDDAGSITGNSSVCQGDNNVNYSVPVINNATSYLWSYSGTGATINGNSESITIDFSSLATFGNLTIKGTNQCGDGIVSSNFSITVNSIPSSPTAGTHTSSQTEIVWNWNSVQGATGYKYHTDNDYSTAVDNGTNTSFTQTGLTCNTAYTLYVWAYNNCGKSDLLILTNATTSCWSCGDNITDNRDANIYQTIQIGNQCWMKEDLKYLPSVVDPGTGSETIPYCYVYGYYGTDVNTAKSHPNYLTYGAVYNWPAAIAGYPGSNSNPSGVQGICPTGWHLPSDAEWKQLEIFLGMSQAQADATDWRGTDEGGKLKKTGTTNWRTPNTGATNSSGFNAISKPGRSISGNFGEVDVYACWWSATEVGTNAWRRLVSYDTSTIYRPLSSKGFGYAVRCIKD